jgi:hypothetical protein
MKTSVRLLLTSCIPLALYVSGCATVPYHYGTAGGPPALSLLGPGEPQVERGCTNALLDGVGWVLGIPTKIILLDSRMDNHAIGTNVEVALRAYLATNGLSAVKVRLNQYAPGGEWSRWHRNTSIAWGWRYTLGLLGMLGYTLLPGRIFGGDNYNPYSDTISLYSNHPAVGLHEGGHAKDFAGRTYKGTYAAAYMLPLVALYPEALATGDALGYLRREGTAEEEQAAYKILYPAYATYIGGGIGQFTPYSFWFTVGAVVPAHVIGRVKASGVEARRAAENTSPRVAP